MLCEDRRAFPVDSVKAYDNVCPCLMRQYGRNFAPDLQPVARPYRSMKTQVFRVMYLGGYDIFWEIWSFDIIPDSLGYRPCESNAECRGCDDSMLALIIEIIRAIIPDGCRIIHCIPPGYLGIIIF